MYQIVTWYYSLFYHDETGIGQCLTPQENLLSIRKSHSQNAIWGFCYEKKVIAR